MSAPKTNERRHKHKRWDIEEMLTGSWGVRKRSTKSINIEVVEGCYEAAAR